MTRRTKIVCTIGPASADEATLARLIDAGMNVARLNMSHGTHDSHAEALARIRRLAAERGVTVAALQDLQGPKIRTGVLAGGGPVLLLPDATVEITTEETPGTADRISTSYRALPTDVAPGARILLSDGLIELRVEAVTAVSVRCRVVNGGRLFERQGINLPGVDLAAPSLTPKDLTDLDWGIAQGVDYVAVSFVRRPEDLDAARARLRAAGATIPLIAKLEKPQALQRLDDILTAADGVMVARGDMGVELPPEEAPAWQKRIISAANRRLKPVITATQMLESMVHNPRPTRAEATDVANAVWDGTDAVMLSAETAAGEYPVEAVRMMDRIARAAEAERGYMLHAPGPRHAPPAATTPAALRAAHAPDGEERDFPYAVGAAARIVEGVLPDVAAIVAFTRDGATARLISKERPWAPVLALTDDAAVERRLALYWGVRAALSAPVADLPGMLREAERAALAAGLARPGDALLVVGHLPPESPGSTNFMTLHRVG
ncbi:MAG: pyruvate kinase [Dehalococcoidia bacterium]